jgi:hypothetical protein
MRTPFKSCFAVAAATMMFSATANANGRFPRAMRLVEDSVDPNRLSLAATFGMVVTSDRGKNWYHICESAFSLQDTYNGDPLLSVLPSGGLLVDVQSSLNVSNDRGCAWTPTLGSSTQTIADFTVSPSSPNLVIAVVTSFAGGIATTRLQQSTDGGVTWAVVGTPLPVPLVYTVDVDHADPTHIYATGLSSTGAGVFLSSTNRGTTWTSSTIRDTNADDAPYIAAIDPHDANKIFVRTDASPIVDGIATANDALLYSSDGGKTWTELMRKGAKLFGFALSPDGNTVLAGYGDPQQAEMLVNSAVFGIYASPIGNFNFAPIFTNSITCLAWTGTGLYACTSFLDTGFELGFAPDANLTKCPLTSILKLSDIRGTLPGCASAATKCDFAASCMTFQCSDSGTGMPATPAPGCGIGDADAGQGGGGSADAGGATGTGGARGTGGSPGTGGRAGSGGSTPAGDASTTPPTGGGSDSGGGCAFRGGSGSAASAGAVGFLAGLFALVRARAGRNRKQWRSS